MYTGNKRKIVAVWVFTYHDDGKLNMTQTTPDKSDFNGAKAGLAAVVKWCRKTLAAGDTCPYSPDNPTPIDDDNSADDMIMDTDYNGGITQ